MWVLINSLKPKANDDKHVIQSNDNIGNDAALEQMADAHSNEDNTFMKAFIQNVGNNLKTSKNNYQYNEYVKRFALSLYILACRNAYEFVRINLPGVIPSIATIESYMKCTNNFHTLENWFKTAEKSSLLNLLMFQPITSNLSQSAPFTLAAYGPNNKVISIDIIRRWLYIYNECLKQSIRIIGFSTDCDAKYLKSMRFVSGFFASLPNIPIIGNKDDNLFEINILAKWSSWFFLNKQAL
ncbi:unnamed protein product [Didymodactylos carnosus]|uniref:THAP9-like helix-turn-helix domain-containing protein n=1 Tax=Didymodactylos carnosus TaxID=1234261 RepID=A0A814WT84_9BILA|nr:unnamed protein product [Didymodactylos carnosus]CAF3970943.1 unnamed protein product [Didymodactylos carnosus]